MRQGQGAENGRVCGYVMSMHKGAHMCKMGYMRVNGHQSNPDLSVQETTLRRPGLFLLSTGLCLGAGSESNRRVPFPPGVCGPSSLISMHIHVALSALDPVTPIRVNTVDLVSFHHHPALTWKTEPEFNFSIVHLAQSLPSIFVPFISGTVCPILLEKAEPRIYLKLICL